RGAGRGRAQTEGALRGGELLLGTVHVDETPHADEETDEQDAPPQRAAAAAAEAPDVDEDTDDEDACADERRPAGAGVPGLGDRRLRGSGRRRPVRARGRVGGGAVRRLRGPVGAGARRRDGLRGRVVDPELPALRRRRPRRVGLPVGGRGEAGRDVPPRGRVESLSHSATVTLRRRPTSARRRAALPIASWDDAVVTGAPPPWTRHYQPGVPARIELPTESLVELYERSVAEAGSAVATEFFGRETSYAELGDQIARAAAGLRELGVRAGDRVALVLPNCPQHIVAVYAVLRLGAAVVAHTPLYPARELRHMFEDHGARVVIAWDAAVAKLREQPSDIELDRIVSVNLLTALPRAKQLALRLPVPRLRALRGKLTQPAPGTMAWEELLQSPPIDPAHPRPAVDDLAVIQYTSGTTGRPKGATLTHANLYANARQGEEIGR